MYDISLCCNKVSVSNISEAIQSEAIRSKFRSYSQYNHMKFRGISDETQMDFRGSQMVFKVTSGGFPMKFQMDFRAVSGGSQIIFRRFSVPLNQILFRTYSEHKSPLVQHGGPLRAIDISGVAIDVARTSALFRRGQTRSWS